MSIYGPKDIKKVIYEVMTQSRELTNYCQESVRPRHSRRFVEALNSIQNPTSKNLILNTIQADELSSCPLNNSAESSSNEENTQSTYQRAIQIIESILL